MNPPKKRPTFPLTRWLLAPRTTWRARRLAATYGPGLNPRTAWALARLASHPDEEAFAQHHLSERDKRK